MKNFKIQPLDIKNDLIEIDDWERQYENDPKFDSIRKYILEDNIFYGLYEVIHTNYEILPIGNNERKFALSIKNSDDKIIGFILALVDNLQTKRPELMLQYIVMHPEYQNKGIGHQVIEDLLENHKKYFNTEITDVFVRIHSDNTASIKTFKKLGFSFDKKSKTYLSAQLNLLENIKE